MHHSLCEIAERLSELDYHSGRRHDRQHPIELPEDSSVTAVTIETSIAHVAAIQQVEDLARYGQLPLFEEEGLAHARVYSVVVRQPGRVALVRKKIDRAHLAEKSGDGFTAAIAPLAAEIPCAGNNESPRRSLFQVSWA